MSPEPFSPGPAFKHTQSAAVVEITFEGASLRVPAGVSVAAALLMSGRPAGRLASRSGQQRSVFCGIGQCFDCMMIIDGASCQQSCMTRVRHGMSVVRQTA